jgi:modulator of FtsH protease HflC
VKKHIGSIVIALLIVGILLLYMVTFTVRWQEKALVLTFGKISHPVTEAGLKWMWPYPIQSVVKFDGRIRTLDQQTAQTQTRDKTNVIATVYINWKIVEPKLFYERFRKGGTSGDDVVYEAEKTLRGWLAGSANIIAEYNLGELVTEDAEKFRLPELEKGKPGQPGGMLAYLTDKVGTDGGSGIEIVDLGIKRLGVPDSVSGKVFERMTADREAVVITLLAEGASEARRIKGEADSRARIIEAEARAKAKNIMGKGDAEAAQYYAVFLDNPQLANYLRKLETLRKTLNRRTTVILDSESAPYNLLQKLPQVKAEMKNTEN